MSNQSLHQNPPPGNGQAFTEAACFPHADNRIAWLQAKIDHYQSEVARLEAELTHARALLKGHQMWQAEAQKAGER